MFGEPATTQLQSGQDLYQLHLHRHVDGEEHVDGVGLPQDQGVLQGEARAGVPGGGQVNSQRSKMFL